MVTMPVTSIKCVSFSPDGRFLASVGKDTHNKELIVVWDISKIHKGDKPEIAAK
jgi:WD40 repeat protein